MAKCINDSCGFSTLGRGECQRCIGLRRKTEYEAMSPQDKLLDDFAWAVADGARYAYHDAEAKQLLRDAVQYAGKHLDGLMFVEASDQLFDLARALNDQLPDYLRWENDV